MKELRVHKDGRFLETADGRPFFWMADTAWELFHRLTREEILLYLQKRSAQGFNVVLAVALAEVDGLRVPNRQGAYPLKKNKAGNFDPSLPDADGPDSYWDLVDYAFGEAERQGIYLAFLPTWGDKYNASHWGKGPEVFDSKNAKVFGQWLGARYGKFKNLIWVLGGDRPLQTEHHFSVIRSLVEGIKSSGSQHLITFHPPGVSSSSLPFPDETWLDFHLTQTGHGTETAPHYEVLEKDYRLTKPKPVVEGETNYEDHPIGFKAANGYFDQVDVRRSSYWALMAGSLGITYGHHCVWPMRTQEDNLADPWSDNYFLMDWRTALDRPGASQIRHMKTLFESRDFFSRVPDQSLVIKNFEGMNHIQACRGNGYAFVYLPNGIGVTVRLGVLGGKTLMARWFDPRLGTFVDYDNFPNTGERFFRPPLQGRDHDYVLVLDSQE